MLRLYVWLMDHLRREAGQDMVEYALITVVISLAIVLVTIGILSPAFSKWATGLAAAITNFAT